MNVEFLKKKLKGNFKIIKNYSIRLIILIMIKINNEIYKNETNKLEIKKNYLSG